MGALGVLTGHYADGLYSAAYALGGDGADVCPPNYAKIGGAPACASAASTGASPCVRARAR